MAGKVAVSSELQTRIAAAAARLDYEPNLAARTLASRRSGLLAIVVSPLDDGVVVRTAAAALCALERRGYGVLLVSETTAEHLDMPGLARRGVEAVLFVGRAPGRAEREALSARRLAWVAVADADDGDPRCLEFGRPRAVELACRYLQQTGRRSVGLLGRPGLALTEWVRQLVQTGTAIDLTAPALPGSALRRLLETSGQPAAIVCADDLAALAVLRECALRGISIPQDLAVVGFGDEPFARCARPALTTVRPVCAEVGAHAAEALLDVLAGRSCAPYAPRHKLVLRETTDGPENVPRGTTGGPGST